MSQKPLGHREDFYYCLFLLLHLLSSFHIPRSLSQSLFVCVTLTFIQTHAHTQTSHTSSSFWPRVAACLFPLLFCPPLERDRKVSAHSHIQSSVSVPVVARRHVGQSFGSALLHLRLGSQQLNSQPGSSCWLIWTMMMHTERHQALRLFSLSCSQLSCK